MSYKIERRIFIIFAASFVCTFLLLLRYSFQASADNDEVAKDESTDEVKQLMSELDQLEKTLLRERKDLEELERRIQTKLDHPRARIQQRVLSKNSPQQTAVDSIWAQPIPVLVFVCNRPTATREHVQKLIKYRPSKEKFPIIVSQDCDDRAIREVVQEFGDQVNFVKHISSETARIKIPPEHRKFAVYYKIARHYKLALDYVFTKKNYSSVIMTEDDLDIAPDFFEYFLATRPLLESDKTLFCVSAWNDNGKQGLIDPTANSLLYRSDFFPGLGWMMTREFWHEIGPRWPPGFWDDFIREPEQRRNRSCIRPEISRTAMTDFGKIGASKGLFFNRHLKRIQLNKVPFAFTQLNNLTALLGPDYEKQFLQRVYSLPKIGVDELMGLEKKKDDQEYRIEYESMDNFVVIGQRLGLMVDTKAGVPRTAYFGVVSCFFNGLRLHIAPSNGMTAWQGYDRHWEAPKDVLGGLL